MLGNHVVLTLPPDQFIVTVTLLHDVSLPYIFVTITAYATNEINIL
jgi:hypothetical protein